MDVDTRIKHLKEEKRRSMMILADVEVEIETAQAQAAKAKKIPPPIAPKPVNANRLSKMIIPEDGVYTASASNLSIQSDSPMNGSMMITESTRDVAGLRPTGPGQRERPGQYRKALQPVNAKPVRATPLRKTGVQFSVRGSIRRKPAKSSATNSKKGQVNALKGSWRKQKATASPLQRQQRGASREGDENQRGVSPMPELMNFGAKRAIWGTTV